MQYTSKYELTDMIRFVERQIVFTIETTAKVSTYHEFLASQDSMVLFNSTCMCLQSIGEVIRQVDDRTEGRLFSLYPTTPWKQIIGMRNIISHEYLSIDPELVLDITRSELHPLLTDIRRILADIDAGLRDNELREGSRHLTHPPDKFIAQCGLHLNMFQHCRHKGIAFEVAAHLFEVHFLLHTGAVGTKAGHGSQ